MDSNVKLFMIDKIEKLEKENNNLKRLLMKLINELENEVESCGLIPLDLNEIKSQMKGL